MNLEMRAAHMETLTEPAARAAYDTLCEVCEARDGGMTAADQMLIYTYARAECVRQACIQDIAARGLGSERSNGRQRYYQENKAVAHERASAEQQRKILSELRLTPAARKALPMSLEEGDFDTF